MRSESNAHAQLWAVRTCSSVESEMASSSESGVSDRLVSKAGSKSTVWLYFGFEADSEGKAKQVALATGLCRKQVLNLLFGHTSISRLTVREGEARRHRSLSALQETRVC